MTPSYTKHDIFQDHLGGRPVENTTRIRLPLPVRARRKLKSARLFVSHSECLGSGLPYGSLDR